ncbi:MAG: MAPEG family protein [Alcanivoracaceae bacterium]|nr:MAPEG family protein [Alcanivoracaceae bacterium]
MLHITSLFAALLALLIIFLAYKVSSFRRSKKIGIGDNGDKEGMLAIRVHANAIENIPLLLILMAVYEVNQGSSMVLYVLGALAVIARVMHAYGLSKSAGVTVGRFYGIALTWIVIITLAVLNIYKFIIQI